jgi:hypothetical protein
MKEENKCAFCGKSTNYWFPELQCYICPTCLGEYKKALTFPISWNDYRTDRTWEKIKENWEC